MKRADGVEVLLVEDSPDDAEIAMRTLRSNGLVNRVVWIKDGPEALDYLHRDSEAGRPRLVLLDVAMPKMDGLEVLAAIRADQRTATLPVVMLTASNAQEHLARSYALGANSYVPKPVSLDQLTTVVAQLGLYWMLVNRLPGA